MGRLAGKSFPARRFQDCNCLVALTRTVEGCHTGLRRMTLHSVMRYKDAARMRTAPCTPDATGITILVSRILGSTLRFEILRGTVATR